MNKRIDDIEILRGFSVLLIAVHHARGNLWTTHPLWLERLGVYFSGTFCVDLFFAISGFLIARDLIPKIQERNGRDGVINVILAFWIRRAWRILPSAWLWLFLMLCAVILFNDSGVFGDFRTNLEATIAGMLNVANIRFAETFGVRSYGVSFVYWTLSLEEQFYLIFPLLVYFSGRYLVLIISLLIAVQLLSERSLLMIMFRTDAIAFGILLAIWSRHSSYELARPVFLASRRYFGTLIMGVLFFFMGVCGSSVLSVISYKFSIFSTLTALLLWIASYNMNVFVPVPYLKALMLWIGSRSYAIYLTHIPMFFLAREIIHRNYFGPLSETNTTITLLALAVTFIVLSSELNYRFVETPLRLRGSAIARRFAERSDPVRNAVQSGGVS